MTVRQIGFLVWEYYRRRLNLYEKKALDNILGGISGLGEITDEEVKEYLSEKQVNFIKNLGKRFRITKKSF